MAIPEESQLTDKPVKSDRDGYFKLILSGLKPGKTYPFEFRWAYQDGTYGPWSSVKNIETPAEELPGDPKLDPSDVVAVPGGIIIKWKGKLGLVDYDPVQFDRIDVHITGTSYGDGTKPAGSFRSPFEHLFKAQPGIYIVQIKAYYKSGVSSFFSEAYTITVPAQEEEVQTPVTPKGFSSERVLSGIEVAWDGTYTGNAEWYGFQAVNIYAGTSATATSGTYIKVGQMTANKTENKIVIPVDGVYVRYDQPVYIHASSINKKAEESSIVSNVTSQSLGGRSAISSDLANNIITNEKLVNEAVSAAKIATAAITEVKIDTNAITAAKIAAGAITEVKIDTDAVTAAKIAAGAITETKIASNAITAPKIAAGAIEAGKIAAGAITAEKIAASAIEADKIAANAITATKIAAGAIEAGKIAAGAITAEKIAASAIEADKIAANAITSAKIAANSISADKIVSSAITADKIATNAITATKIEAGSIDVNKLAAGTISVNNLEAGSLKTTTYIRAGVSGGGRIDISASASSGIPAGFYIYNSGGTAVFEAPLGGGVIVTGSLKATEISTNSGKFSVNTSGILNATSADISGTIKADGGNIGGIIIASDAIQNGASSAGSTFRLDNTGKARFGSDSGNSIILNPNASIGGATESAKSYIYHSTDGGSTSAGVFRVQADGKLFATGAEFTGAIKTGSSITGTTINGSSINGGSINISNTSFTADDGDSDSGAGSSFNTSQSNAFYSLYQRAPFGGYSPVTCVGFNAIGLISTSTAGVVSSWYPYYDGAADLGVKYSPTYLTNPYRWRHLRLTGSVMVGGDGSSDTPVAAPATNGPRTRLYSDGGIYANSLNQGSGTTTGSTVVQNSSGYLKVSTSSRRFKENIIEIPKSGYLNATYMLNPVSFNYINETEEEPTIAGLIAEDVDLIPEFKGVVNYDSEGLPLSIAYDRMSSLLVLAIKEIKDRLDSIEQRLDAIE